MTSRERVETTCRFEEPDRVPLDLGGSTGASGIHVQAYAHLRRHLGLSNGTITCNDVMQMLAVVEADVRAHFGVDVAAISPVCVVQDWEDHPLIEGLGVRLPAGLDMGRRPDGTWVLTHPSGKRLSRCHGGTGAR